MSVQTSVDIDVNFAGITSLRGELKRVNGELASLTVGSDAFNKMADKAAAIKDKMMEVNEQISVMATGSKYERVSNSLGEIGAGLRDMDFDRVTQGAKLFSQTAKAITFKDAMGSFKQLGSAMASVGKTILMNPLFIIAGVIIGIGVAVYKLLDKMGVLKKIFEAVGKAIAWVTQQIKDFLDWLNLTDFKAEDTAKKQAEFQEKIAKAYEEKGIRVVDTYDHEIQIAKIAGKDTTHLERQKQEAIAQTAKAQYLALQAQMEALKKSGDLTKEKADEIRKAMKDLKKSIHEAKQEIGVINAQEVADNNAKNEKKATDNAAAAKAERDRRKQYDADRLAASRAIQDAELALMKEGIEKERAENAIKFQRQIEDTLSNEKLLASEKKSLKLSLQQQEFEALKAIEQKYLDETNEAVRLANENQLIEEQRKNEVLKAASAEMAEIAKENAAKEIERQKIVKETSLDLSQALLNGLAANLKEGSIAAKGVAIAQATIDTYRAATAAFASTAANPISIAFPAAPYLAAAAAVAMGVANIRKIAAVGGASGGSGASVTPSMSSQNGTFQPSQSLTGYNGGGTNDFGSNQGQTNVTTVVVASEIEAVNSQSNGLLKMGVL